ncbi:diiron oxygenase [Rhodococcus sp. NPDC127528]|uniref:AurF N-oxygenase family protein n=1 Tax=unclassified Rhodococcus (in: high G+C Gram-positive bacteria) TaxID=192944 RepID=UPI00364208C7
MNDRPAPGVENPRLPEFDPDDPVESAVIAGLVRSWPRRATVRRAEPDLDEVFDPAKADYAEELVPFRDHETYLALDEATRDRIRAWAWIAYNKNVVDIEQHVVNPGFQLLLEDSLHTGLGDTARASVVQAMVDEQYHTLMHLNASALTRRRRPWPLPERALPTSLTVVRGREAVAAQDDPRAAALVTLAFTTVAETSIGAYLSLIADDETVQPVNKATVALHRRDERAHASVTSELVKLVYDRLHPDDRRILLSGMADGVAAFTGTDYSVWSAILAEVGVAGADAMLRDVAAGPGDGRLVQDCSAIDRLRAQLADPRSDAPRE